jgi:tetratricopeptide (TPR) repeat protein
MSGAGRPIEGDRKPPTTLVTALERACDRFEADCRAGLRPRIEDYLNEMPAAGRATLERELQALERAYDRSRDGPLVPLKERPTESGGQGRFLPESVPPTIAGYEILGELGRGGMGVVYRAWQPSLNRAVALKVILAGAHAGPAALARFRTEAEAAARLQHPHIVPIFEVGEQAGMPYAVLELVDGGTLAARLAGTPMPLRQAAELAETLARAVDHAHGRGVIHRDLKPVNILMTADGTPKVADFGLAKLIVGGGVSLTQTGDVLGTPSYMAPEQAGSQSGIGPAADLYALGAILYELLTGRPPFKAETPQETIRQVVSAEPLAPSRLRPKLSRDLETICLKCLEKEPSRRYSSAAALAEDLRRFLAGEPIRARPVSLLGRAWRWGRRNKVVAGLAASFVAALVVGTAMSTWQAVQATQARNEARQAYKQARANEVRAKEQAAEARRAAAESKAVLKFFQSQVLSAARPEGQDGGLGKGATIRQAVDAAESGIAGSFQDQPAVEASIRNTLGTTYWYLGEAPLAFPQYERALELRRRELGPDHPDTLAVRNNLALAYYSAGRFPEAIALHEETLKLREAQLGPDHPDTLTSRNNLAETYRVAGRTAEAIALHAATLKICESKLGPDHPDTLQCRNNLGIAYYSAGQTAEAIALHETTLKLREVKLSPDHLDTLTSRDNLAEAYRVAGRLSEAIELMEPTLKLFEAKVGLDHPYTLTSRNNLAGAYQAAGRTHDAITMLEANLKLVEAKLSPDHPDTLNSRGNLALAYCDAGRIVEAIALHEATLKVQEAKIGPDHPDTLSSCNNLAHAYESLGRWTEAERLRRDTLARRRHAEKADSPLLAADLIPLSRNLLIQSRWSEAEPLLREALAIREKATPDDWSRFDVMSLLGGSLLGRRRYAEAEPLIVTGYEMMKIREVRITVPERYCLREAAERVVHLYEAWGKPEQAAEWKATLGMPNLPAEVFARP